MVIISGKPGFRFPPKYFEELAAPNSQKVVITTAGIIKGIDKVDAIFIKKGVYEAMKQSPYYLDE